MSAKNTLTLVRFLVPGSTRRHTYHPWHNATTLQQRGRHLSSLHTSPSTAMDARINHYQKGPRLGNPYLEDPALQRYVEHFLDGCGAAERSGIVSDLERFGDKCVEYMPMAQNSETFLPRLEQFDQWGRRVDKLHLSEGWKFFQGQSAIEGLVSIPYENPQARSPFARLHQAVKLAMFAPSSGMYSCPLAMTDGATFAINRILNDPKTDLPESTLAQLRLARGHLTSRDPEQFWTSGQWFTEKKGGSDLARATDTFAVKIEDGEAHTVQPGATHHLNGYKWFTSAVDAQMTFTLAYVEDDKDAGIREGRRSLSMFLLLTRKAKSAMSEEEYLENPDTLNGIQVVRLKDKMCTRQLPTAELILNKSDAFLVSPEGAGIKTVSPMLVITRFHNSLSAVSFVMRMRNLALDFAHKRNAFGEPVVDKPLHVQSLFEYDMDARGNLLMVLEMARLLGLVEMDRAEVNEEAILRVLTSLAKLFTARETTRLMSEGVELFGAVGIMHNHISTLFRDSTVLPIWEGTSNTIALDLIRISHRESECIHALHESLQSMVTQASSFDPTAHQQLEESITKVFGFLDTAKADPTRFEWNARRAAMNLSRLVVACLASRTAAATGHVEDTMLASHWASRVEREFEPFTDPTNMKAMRSALSSEINGSGKDARGKYRAYL